MRRELTVRQQRILHMIRDAVTAQGYPPSIKEIGEAVGLTSTSSVHSQLAQLEKKGFIRRDPTKPRAIEFYTDDAAGARPPRKLTVDIPVVGHIAAGMPIVADPNIEEYVPLPRDWVGQGELFMLRVRGDSMQDAGVFDGDMVVVRQQETAEDGEMVAALHEPTSATTVKTLSLKDGCVRLLPANEAYQPIDGSDITILGKVVTVLRRV